MKGIILTILIAASSLCSIAQENWLFSPNLGLNIIPIDQGDVYGTTHKLGVSFGFAASQLLEDHWSFDYSISFNNRYAAYQYSEVSDELSSLLNFDGIPILEDLNTDVYQDTKAYAQFWTFDVPISVTYKFSSGFLLYGGGFVNFMLSVRTYEELTQRVPLLEVVNAENLPIDQSLIDLLPQNEVVTTSSTSDANYETFNFGVLGGLGYAGEKWMLKLGYQYGLRDILNDELDVTMGIRNQRAISLSISYLIQDLFVTSNNKARYDLELIE